MPRLDTSRESLVAALTEHYGSGRETGERTDRFASVIAASMQSTVNPRKLDPMLEALRDAGLLEPRALANASLSELTTTVAPAVGPVSDKTLGTLVKVARWVESRGALETWDNVPTSHLREELLSLRGIGPALTDEILLLGLGRPVFPVDRAAYRILVRHGWIDPFAEYDEARELVEGVMEHDHTRLVQISSWFENVGRDFCRTTAAKCENCPLRPFLPEGGPLGDYS